MLTYLLRDIMPCSDHMQRCKATLVGKVHTNDKEAHAKCRVCKRRKIFNIIEHLWLGTIKLSIKVRGNSFFNTFDRNSTTHWLWHSLKRIYRSFMHEKPHSNLQVYIKGSLANVSQVENVTLYSDWYLWTHAFPSIYQHFIQLNPNNSQRSLGKARRD